MVSNWFHIAKAEFRVQTSGIKRNRMKVISSLLIIGFIWALFIAPLLMDLFIIQILQVPNQLLMALMPALMRAAMMLIWVILILFPISNALKEIKIGQWEILLSNRVSTSSIFVGTFLGKLPLNGLIVLFLAPLIVSPFAIAFNISLIGQILVYIALVVFTLTTMWTADLIITIIQVKLGESSRGKDLANALAIVFTLIAIVPLVSFQLFGAQMIEVFGTNIFVLLPFTWAADLITRLAFSYNGIGLDPATLQALDLALGLDLISNILLLSAFTVGMIGIALVATRRLFLHNIGMRTDAVTTITRENLIYRGIRKLISSPFGIVLITTLKDFSRKIQNISRLGMMLGLAIILPVFVSFIAHDEGQRAELLPIMIMMALAFALISPMAFGGVGFLDSKNQLWTIQSAPSGAMTFIKARAAQSALFIVPAALISSTALTLIVGLSGIEFLLLMLVPIFSGVGAALIGIGITASNPTYEDLNSAALRTNNSKIMLVTILAFMLYTIADLVLGMVFGLGDIFQQIYQIPVLYVLLMIGPLPIIGILTIYWGTKKFTQIE